MKAFAGVVDRAGALCAVVAFGAYYNTLDADFAYDDA